MPVLTALDTMGVQRYVFGSNRLRDVVGASALVRWATGRDVGEALADLPTGTVVTSAGGNATLRFSDLASAKEFAATYSRRLLERAPGLEVAIVHRRFHDGELARALLAVQVDMARVKREHRPSTPLLGLGVTAECRETGLPAVGFDAAEPTVPLSAQALAMRDREILADADTRWQKFLPRPPLGIGAVAFPKDIDHLGRSHGEVSLMGVVHVDGNGIGAKITEWLRATADNELADEHVQAEYARWSDGLNDLADRAMQAVSGRVGAAICLRADGDPPGSWIEGGEPSLHFPLLQINGETQLPVRPILMGGDDLTFICDGRIALSLAEAALTVFDQANIAPFGQLHACAGVALCRTHTPFSRAYALAEQLCSSAKAGLRRDGEMLPASALDWHIGAIRPSESLAGMRARQYQVADPDPTSKATLRLTGRPYALGTALGTTRDWRWLTGTLLGAQDDALRGNLWQERRNKVLALGRLVEEGPSGVHQAFSAWQVIDRRLRLPSPLQDGFWGAQTPLRDAAELLDLCLPLPAMDAVSVESKR